MSTHTPTLPEDPAYPSNENLSEGMTKRELMAMHICAGILGRTGGSGDAIAEVAVKQADALIAALNKPPSTPFTGR